MCFNFLWTLNIIVYKIKKKWVLWIELIGKDNLVCFAKKQTPHECWESQTKDGISFDRNWEGNLDGCPSLLCQIASEVKKTW